MSVPGRLPPDDRAVAWRAGVPPPPCALAAWGQALLPADHGPDRLWCPPSHGFAAETLGGWAASVSLSALEAVLQGVDLRPMLPDTLAGAVRSRQLSFLGGRLCARRALAHLVPAGGAAVGRDAQGAPQWPTGALGSITHTDAQAHALVVPSTACAGLGIDSEPVVRSIAEVVELCCTPFERAVWLARAADPPGVATRIFSLKEAFYKAAQPIVRRFIEFQEVEVSAGLLEGHEVRLRASRDDPLLSRLADVALGQSRRPASSDVVHSVVRIAASA